MGMQHELKSMLTATTMRNLTVYTELQMETQTNK